MPVHAHFKTDLGVIVILSTSEESDTTVPRLFAKGEFALLFFYRLRFALTNNLLKSLHLSDMNPASIYIDDTFFLIIREQPTHRFNCQP